MHASISHYYVKVLTRISFLQFKETVIFSAYSENEIQKILEARVGRSVIAPSVLQYVAKIIQSVTGDAQKALEMAVNAVQRRLELTDDTDSTVGHLIKMPDAMLANKEEASNLKGRIEGQPLTGKVILCVLKTLAQAGTFKSTVGELKKYVLDCMRQSGSEDEILTIEDFLVLLETPVDSGLLRVFDDVDVKHSDDGFILSGRVLGEVHQQPIHLGMQLDEGLRN